MEIPIIILLFLYGAIVLVIATYGVFNVYHAFRFGMHTLAAYAMTLVFVVIAGFIVMTTLFALRSVDWSTTFTIGVPTVEFESPLP